MYLGGSRNLADDALITPPKPHSSLLTGHTLNLRCRHIDFRPPASTGEWPPAELERITSDSSTDDIQAAIEWVANTAGWFHSVDLPQGISTPGGRGWEARSKSFNIPSIVSGRSVLDIGAMEGGDTFNAERHGAASVTVCDVDNYFGYDLGRNSAWDEIVERYLAARAAGPDQEWAFMNAKRLGFELCRRARESNAKRISASIYDLDPAVHGVFDVTFCFGLLYHLRHPLLAIDRLRAVTGQVALINNQIAGTGDHEMRFYAETWRGSHTNWFVPTPECFLDMLTSSGFRKLEVVAISETSMSVLALT